MFGFKLGAVRHALTYEFKLGAVQQAFNINQVRVQHGTRTRALRCRERTCRAHYMLCFRAAFSVRRDIEAEAGCGRKSGDIVSIAKDILKLFIIQTATMSRLKNGQKVMGISRTQI